MRQKPVLQRFFLALTAVLLLTTCRPQPAPPPTTVTPSPTHPLTPSPQPTFTPSPCQFPYTGDIPLRCGYLAVPEDYAHPDRLIRLHVAIVPSSSSSPALDPVVFLDGGPGGHTLAAADSLVQSFAPILRHRDVILFDQRGVGYSQPALDCPELQAAELATIEQDLDPAEQNANHLAALAACRDRLTAAGVNLAAYHSAASAADLDALRQALGYDTWNLFGISYGTRLALTALRDYGDTGTIRSAVLDSVYPPQVDSQAILGPNAARALSLLFARCAADAACSAAYPNLETRFYALVDRLNAEPTPVVITDRQNRTTYRVPFNGDDLLETMFGMMYDANQIIQLPRMVAHLEQNRKTAVANWLTNGLYLTESAGMATSVQCTEEYPFASQAAFEANLADLPPQIAQWMAAYAAPLTGCDVWQVPAADPRENEPVRSDVPTLLLAGDYDPITPPDGARETAAHLSHAYYFEFAGQSHGVARHSCGIALVIAFLDQPDAPPDASCLERLYFGFITE